MGFQYLFANIRGNSSSKTNIDLRWHKRDEYDELSSENMQELYEWQKSKYGKVSINNSRNKYNASTTIYSGHTTRKFLQANISALEAKLKKGFTVPHHCVCFGTSSYRNPSSETYYN